MNKLIKVKLSAKAGFTLVEVSVVMTIMAIMGVWAFGSYLGAKKEVYVHFIANRLQTDIREVFINAISTKKETVTTGECRGGSTAKVKALRIRLGESSDPYDVISYCEDSTGALKAGAIDDSDPSEFLNYKQDISAIVDLNGVSYGSGGFVYLVFTSPYGKYYTYYINDPSGYNFVNHKTDLGLDPLSSEIEDSTKWRKNKSLEYYPVDTPLGVYSTITFDSDSTSGGITHVLRVSDIGNAELD